jgi:hypothetical protein
MNMNTIDMLLIFDISNIVPLPFTIKFWVDNLDDKIVDNNGNFLVFNVPA